MKSGSTVYFGCAPQYLDPFSLTHRWFAAVWRYEANLKMVEGFWFSAQKEDVINQIKAKWRNGKEVSDPIEIKSIYEHIRKQQKQQDWNKRTRLSYKSAFFGRGTKPGWYVVHSDANYPFYISLVKKSLFFARIMHADICENATDERIFIERINREHNITIKPV